MVRTTDGILIYIKKKKKSLILLNNTFKGDENLLLRKSVYFKICRYSNVCIFKLVRVDSSFVKKNWSANVLFESHLLATFSCFAPILVAID